MTDAPRSSDLAAIADGVVSTDVIARLNRYAVNDAPHRGQTEDSRGHLKQAPSERRSDLVWIAHTPEHKDIYDMLAGFVRRVNDEIFRLELTGFSEMLQVATYRSEERGFYAWHLDIGSHERGNRKLSLIAPLTDPTEYEGGELQLLIGSQPTTIEMPLGRVVAFPSYVLHRITPVTRGLRRSLVAWISGPRFR